MAEVKVLVKGVHDKVDENNLKIGSTVSLIKSDKNIIVDTGSFLDKETLIAELKKEGLTPEEIDIVVLTHLHLDHTVNTYLFSNAKIFYRLRGNDFVGLVGFPKEGKIQRFELTNNEIADYIVPGHGDMFKVEKNV